MTRSSTPGPTLPDLYAMDGASLLTLYDALDAAARALQGVLSQPRCSDDHSAGGGLNVAGQAVEALMLRCMDEHDRVAEAGRARVPTDEREAEHLAWLELQYLVRGQDDLSAVAATAALMAHRASVADRRIAA